MCIILFEEARKRLQLDAPPPIPPTPPTPLCSQIDAFEAYLRGRHRRPRGIRMYCWSLQRFFAWLGDDATHADLTAIAVQGYVEQLAGRGLKPASTINALATIRAFCLCSIAWGHRTDDVTAGIQRPAKQRPAPKPLVESDVRWLLDLIREPVEGLTAAARWRWRRNQRLIYLMLYAGLRASEAVDVLWEDVALAEGMLAVRDGKGGKGRLITLHASLAALLEAVPTDERRPSFAIAGKWAKDATGRAVVAPLSHRSIQHLFDRWIDELKTTETAERIDALHAHRLRHTFACLLLWNDADLKTIQELLGHAQLGTTEWYLQADRKRKQAAVARIPDLG